MTPRISWSNFFFSLFWLGGLIIFVSPMISRLWEDPPTDWIPYALLLAFCIGGVNLLRPFLWMLLGRETITIKRSVLKVRRQVLDIGFTRTYTISQIRNLRINPRMTPTHWRNTRNRYLWRTNLIEFEYESSTIKFGAELDLTEANLVLEEFKKNRNFIPSNFTADISNWINDEAEE